MRGHRCILLAPEGLDIAIEQLDDDAHEWHVSGPGGACTGAIAAALPAARGAQPDDGWVTAVTAALAREVTVGRRRPRPAGERSAAGWRTRRAAGNVRRPLREGERRCPQ